MRHSALPCSAVAVIGTERGMQRVNNVQGDAAPSLVVWRSEQPQPETHAASNVTHHWA